jgi:hypothetical protein
MAAGVFWDGGLGFPNPVELALWESSRLWPETVADVVISFGTGVEPRSGNNARGPGRSVGRLWTSFMNFLDGESRFHEVKNGLGKDLRGSFFRFNGKLQGPTLLDDVRNLDLIRQSVIMRPLYDTERKDVAKALLISNFYFELDHQPVFETGMYRYQGSIRCRTDCQEVINALSQLVLPPMEYVTETEVLAEFRLDCDICQVCHRYRRNVILNVRHPSDLVTISLRTSKGIIRKISGFPETMAWFEEQQSFGHNFGTEDHDTPRGLQCFSCSPTSGPGKRAMGSSDSGRQKRMRR